MVPEQTDRPEDAGPVVVVTGGGSGIGRPDDAGDVTGQVIGVNGGRNT